jgi:hypothetical protein
VVSLRQQKRLVNSVTCEERIAIFNDSSVELLIVSCGILFVR